MFHKLRNRIAAIASVSVLAAAPLAFVATPALAAGSGNQFCYYNMYATPPQACLNAWSGGPGVDVYTSTGAVNNDFTLVPAGSSYALEDTDGGAYNGKCIGDANNNSGLAYTGLDTCPNPNTGGGGWGTNFTVYYCTGEDGNAGYEFYDNHWQGYLGPTGFTNGDAFYMNNSYDYCFSIHSKA
jgi:hypothetical protein